MGAPCIVCELDGRRKMHGAPLCGECWKEWQSSGEVRRASLLGGDSSFHRRAFEDFVRRRQAEKRNDIEQNNQEG